MKLVYVKNNLESFVRYYKWYLLGYDWNIKFFI